MEAEDNEDKSQPKESNANKVKNARYTPEEDWQILQFISITESQDKVKGNALWQVSRLFVIETDVP